MEVAGLILAVVMAVFIAYAVPVWSRRKYAVATSRKDDRFSDHLTLLEANPASSDLDFGPSSRPILLNATVSVAARGNAMSEKETGTPGATPDTRSELGATQEFAALRARRAARISTEQVAAKRRLVTAGVGVLMAAVISVLAAMGSISWMWIAVPVVFLVATLIASAVAGEQTIRIADAESARLAELREQIGRGRRTSTLVEVQARVAEVEAKTGAHQIVAPEVEVSVQDLTNQAQETLGEVAVQRVSGGEWDYVPLPKPTYATKDQVVGRIVHADTDIVSVRPLSSVAVPGRPTKASAPKVRNIVDANTGSNPTFKFDLDAVLEQRRAQ